MNLLFSVLRDFNRFFSVKTRKGLIRLLTLVIFAVVAIVFLLKPSANILDESTQQVRSVITANVATFSNSASTQLVGTVSSIDQAVIQSESSGRVIAVGVRLGQTVSAGQVIARLENASEYAAVLQAEGVYEGALSVAQVGDISVTEASNTKLTIENNVLNTYRASYTTVSNVLYNTLDDFFGNPNFSVPGVRINVGNQTSYLNNERVFFSSILPVWQKNSVVLKPSDVKEELLRETISHTTRLLAMTDIFIAAVEKGGSDEMLNGVLLSSYAVTLNGIRNTLTTTLASLESSIISLQNAEEMLKKAKLGGTTSEVSSSNAQVKQALGTLKAAQANYNKTILRSPINGVVNSITIQTGDFVSGFQTIAEIANNDALEITTFIGQSDRASLSVQQQVLIAGTIPGVVSTIAPAINTATGKFEVKIQSTSPNLVNGDTVTITLEAQPDATGTGITQVPLTAVKFTATAGVVYSVEDGMLVAHTVEIGAVRDIYIAILAGVTSDMEIVVDARGLNEGERVTVVSN